MEFFESSVTNYWLDDKGSIISKCLMEEMSYFIDDSLDQVKLSLQRRVEQQSQRVELHSHAVINALRAGLTQVGPLPLKRRS